MVARLYYSIDFLAETDDAVIALASTSVDVVQLCHQPIYFKFLQEDFPLVVACVFDRVFSDFIRGLTHHA